MMERNRKKIKRLLAFHNIWKPLAIPLREMMQELFIEKLTGERESLNKQLE